MSKKQNSATTEARRAKRYETREAVAAVVAHILESEEFWGVTCAAEHAQCSGVDWYASMLVGSAIERGVDEADVVRLLARLVRETDDHERTVIETLLTKAEELLQGPAVERESPRFFAAQGMISWHEDGEPKSEGDHAAAGVLTAALWTAVSRGDAACRAARPKLELATRRVVRLHFERACLVDRRQAQSAADRVVDVLEAELHRLEASRAA